MLTDARSDTQRGGALIVVVDDERFYPEAHVHLRSGEESMRWFSERPHCAEVWLDHDLGGDDTTRELALWFVEQHVLGTPLNIEAIYVHSMNPVGSSWLVSTLERYYVTRIARFF